MISRLQLLSAALRCALIQWHIKWTRDACHWSEHTDTEYVELMGESQVYNGLESLHCCCVGCQDSFTNWSLTTPPTLRRYYYYNGNKASGWSTYLIVIATILVFMIIIDMARMLTCRLLLLQLFVQCLFLIYSVSSRKVNCDIVETLRETWIHGDGLYEFLTVVVLAVKCC